MLIESVQTQVQANAIAVNVRSILFLYEWMKIVDFFHSFQFVRSGSVVSKTIEKLIIWLLKYTFRLWHHNKKYNKSW